jgi:hypothetical protein
LHQISENICDQTKSENKLNEEVNKNDGIQLNNINNDIHDLKEKITENTTIE